MITLATLPQATEQQVFDQVVTHLLTQKERAKVPGSARCHYRYNGLKCAAGCLISEEEYKAKGEKMENAGGWDALISDRLAPPNHEDLIMELQYVHDQFAVSEWVERLQMIANDFNLNFNPPATSQQ